MALEMLWPNNGEAAVLQSFRRAKWTSDAQRKLAAERRLAMLEDDWKDMLWERICAVYQSEKIRESVRRFVSIELNPFKRIATELSTVYRWGATREVADASQNAVAKALWHECDIDGSLEVANLYLNALRDEIVVPRVIDGRMTLNLLTPDRFSVVQHPEDPTQPAAFWYERTSANTPESTVIERVYADTEEWRIYDVHSNVLRAWRHDLGRLPGVVLHASRRRDSFFGDTEFEDAVENTLMVGVHLTFLTRLVKFQAELQPTYTGHPQDIATGLTVGADELWVGPGTWGTLNLQADPQKYIEVINARIAWVARQYGLSDDAYQLGGDTKSGFELRLKRLPLLEQRARQIKIWRRAEKDLFLLMAMVSEREHPVLKLDPMGDFSVNFTEEPMQEDPLIQNRIWSERIAMNVLKPSQVKMELDPDLTREEAMEEIQATIDERAIWVEKTRALQFPADPTKPVGKSAEENGADGARAAHQNEEHEEHEEKAAGVMREAAMKALMKTKGH